MRRALLLVSTTALVMLVACGAALAASIDCPNASGGYCYGTPQGDALYGTPDVDRMYGYGTGDLMNGYGGSDFMFGGNESGLGDKMSGGTGADLVNGQDGNDLIEGGPGSDTLKTGTGSDRVEAQDGIKDTITCRGSNDAVYYDRGLDVLEGCPNALTKLPPTGSPFEPGTKALVDHEGEQICLPEVALNRHLEHGDKVLSWSGCAEQHQQ
jgi:hypothetical protein